MFDKVANRMKTFSSSSDTVNVFALSIPLKSLIFIKVYVFATQINLKFSQSYPSIIFFFCIVQDLDTRSLNVHCAMNISCREI